jgi:hypothetical protein
MPSEPASPTEPPPKYSLPGGQWLIVLPEDPPPYEIPVDGPDGRAHVIQLGAKPLKFGHMIVLLDDLKLLFDRFRQTPTSATQDEINRAIGLLWSDPDFERFGDWANFEFGRQPDADAAYELRKGLSGKLRVPFDTLAKMPVVEVMRLVDEHSAVPPASGTMSPAAPKEKSAADPSPEQKADFLAAMKASVEIATALCGRPDAVKLWADAAGRLTLGLKRLAAVRDDETRRLIVDETFMLMARDWHVMAALTPEVDFATGNRGVVTGCFQGIDQAVRKLPVRPDGNQLWSAWYAAHNAIAQAYLIAAAFAAVKSKPAALEGSGTAAQMRPMTASDFLEAKVRWPGPASSPAPPQEQERPIAAPASGSKTKKKKKRKKKARPAAADASGIATPEEKPPALDVAGNDTPSRDARGKPSKTPDWSDLDVVANALLVKGDTLEAAFVRHFKSRDQTGWRDLVEAVCPGEDRTWETVKTWVNRVKNALIGLSPTCRLRFRTTVRGYIVIKVCALE